MSLTKQLKENNILTTIVGFYLVLLIPAFLITQNNINKAELLYENKINTKKIVYVNPNSITPKIFLNNKLIHLKPILDFKKINFIKPLEENSILFNIVDEYNTKIGEGFVTKEGQLSLNSKIIDIAFFKEKTKLNIINNKLSTDNSENIEVSFTRGGKIIIKEDKVANIKRLKFEKSFIKFYLNSVIFEKNKLFLNKFIRDEEIYNKIMNYDFGFKNSTIKEMRLLNKEKYFGSTRSYYILLQPAGGKLNEIEIYITLEEDEKYTKYNSFKLLVKKIKILQINKDEIELFKNKILNITKELFSKNDLFNIELVVFENKINLKNKNKLFKRMLNIEDIEVLGVEKTYDYNTNKELFKLSLKNLNNYNIIGLTFVVKPKTIEVNGEKRVHRDIEDIYIGGK